MLRSFKELWRWHRKAEGGHPPSVLLSLQNILTVLDILSVQVIDRSTRAGFCLQFRALKESHPSPKVGGNWQFFSWVWQPDCYVIKAKK